MKELITKGYNLLWPNHPSNKKRGGVCIYHKEHLPIIKRHDLRTSKECLVMAIMVDRKCSFLVFVLIPSQTQNEFEELCSVLNLFCF